jgi:hypothetical protein
VGNLETKTKIIEVIKINTEKDFSFAILASKIIFSSIATGLIFGLFFNLNHYSFIGGATIGGFFSFYYVKYNLYNRAMKVIQRTGFIPFIGFAAYFIWVSMWLVHVSVWSTGNIPLDNLIRPEAPPPSDFSISYAASALDSLIFFILVGFILAIIALKKPEEEKLNRKIEYIFPDVEPESKLLPYLVESVSALACINTMSERVLTITDISPDNNHIKISLKSHSVIKNIHNNTEYANEKMPWSFTVDAVKDDEAILGEIHELSIVDKIGNSSREKHIIQGIVQFTNEYREHNVTFPMRLSAGQEVIYQANCWVWESAKNPFCFNISRYTQHQKITLLNTTTKELSVTVTNNNSKTNVKDSNTYDLPAAKESGDKLTLHEFPIENRDLCPEHSMTLTFLVKE